MSGSNTDKKTDRWFAIVNPNAGFGTAKQKFAALQPRIANLLVEVAYTTAAGDGIRLARDAYARGIRKFLSVGGDGTTFEVVNGVMQNAPNEPVALAVLPLGTGNSFMRDFGVKNTETALRALTQTQPEAFVCDVLKVTHSDGVLYSFNQMGIGFVAEAGDATNRKYKRLGALGYVAAVVDKTVNLKSHSMRFGLDGATLVEHELTLLAICNSRCTGGQMQMAPNARVDDGMLDVVAIGKLSRTRLLSSFPKIFLGTHVRQHEVTTQRAKKVTLNLPCAQPTIIDGEVLNLKLESVEVIPGVLRIVGLSYPPA